MGWSRGGGPLMPLADGGQGVLLLEDFKDNFEFEFCGKLTFGLAFHTGLNLARYST